VRAQTSRKIRVGPGMSSTLRAPEQMHQPLAQRRLVAGTAHGTAVQVRLGGQLAVRANTPPR
jgi:hypothetical protein